MLLSLKRVPQTRNGSQGQRNGRDCGRFETGTAFAVGQSGGEAADSYLPSNPVRWTRRRWSRSRTPAGETLSAWRSHAGEKGWSQESRAEAEVPVRLEHTGLSSGQLLLLWRETFRIRDPYLQNMTFVALYIFYNDLGLLSPWFCVKFALRSA